MSDTIDPGSFVCRRCHFEAPLDDLAGSSEMAICLRCYCRETGTALPMTKAYRNHLISVLAAIT